MLWNADPSLCRCTIYSAARLVPDSSRGQAKITTLAHLWFPTLAKNARMRHPVWSARPVVLHVDVERLERAISRKSFLGVTRLSPCVAESLSRGHRRPSWPILD